MITFACPGCAQQYRVPDDKAGKRTECPKCRQRLVVPTPEAPPNEEPAPPSDETVSAGNPPFLDEVHERIARIVCICAGVIIVVTITVGLGRKLLLASNEPTPQSSQQSVTSRPPPPSPEAQARTSFEAVVNKARSTLAASSPEPLGEYRDVSWGRPESTDVSAEASVGFHSSTPVTFDVSTTPSLVAPFQGRIRFGARITGTVNGVVRTNLGTPKFAFPFTSDEQVDALYDLRDGRWGLTEVKFTTTDYTAGDADESSFMSQLMVMEVNRGKRAMIGKVKTFPGTMEVRIIRILREAVN